MKVPLPLRKLLGPYTRTSGWSAKVRKAIRKQTHRKLRRIINKECKDNNEE